MKALLFILFLVPVSLIGQTFEFSIAPEDDDIIVDSVNFYFPETGDTFKTVGATEFVIEEKATMLSDPFQINGMDIYPNPAEDHLTLVINEKVASGNISITDVKGQTIYTLRGLKAKDLTLENITDGIYFIRVDNKETSTIIVRGNTTGNLTISPVFREQNAIHTKSANSAYPLPGPWMEGRPIIMDIFSIRRGLITPLQTTTAFTTNAIETGRKISFSYYLCTDDSGKHYPIVDFGIHVWMAENLSMETVSGSWMYDSDQDISDKYGMLYDWETAQEVCPDGWHLPSDAEWTELEAHLNTLTEDTLVADCLKYPGEWLVPIQGYSHTGFKALPAGAFYPFTEEFYNLFSSTYFWTSDEAPEDNTRGYMRKIDESETRLIRAYSVKDYGFSVRCVKDEDD